MTKLWEGFIPLYQVSLNTHIRTKQGVSVFFHHVAGMYSYCELDGYACHLFANEQVEYISKEEYEDYLKGRGL